MRQNEQIDNAKQLYETKWIDNAKLSIWDKMNREC